MSYRILLKQRTEMSNSAHTTATFVAFIVVLSLGFVGSCAIQATNKLPLSRRAVV